MSTASESWERIKAWANANAPAMLELLNPGASEEQLAELQQTLGRDLPAAYLDSLRLHNGESDDWGNVFADMGGFLSCEMIVMNWRMRSEIAKQVGMEFSDAEIAEQIRDNIITVDGPVRPRLFDEAWVPIMDMNGDVYWALDFAPADGGTPGQVIQVDPESCEWRVLAPDFEAFLASYATRLETDEWRMQDGLPTQAEEF